MQSGDFFHNEQSVTVPMRLPYPSCSPTNKATKELREPVALKAGEIIDATVMRKALLAFLAEQVKTQKQRRIVLAAHESHHDEVSDPIIFGHAVKVFLHPSLKKFGDKLAAAGQRQQWLRQPAGQSGQTGCGHPRRRRSRNRRRLCRQP